MEQNNMVNGRKEAGPSGVGGIQTGGAGAGGGPSGVASGDPSGVAAGGAPSRVAGDVAAAAGGPSRYAAARGPISGVAVGADGGPSGYAPGGPISGVAAGADGGPSGVAAAGVPSGDAGDGAGPSSGKRRRIHRHSQLQINAMEAHFKDDPHPNELQRNELARSLGLDPAQVKYWFQNKRTQVKSQSKSEENNVLRTENNDLRARKQQLIEALRKKTCSHCSPDSSRQIMERNNVRSENSHLKKEVELLKSTIAEIMVSENLQNLPVTFQDPQNFSKISHNQQNLPITLHKPHNHSIIPMQNPLSIPILCQNSQHLPIISEASNANSYPVNLGASTISSREGIHSINVPTSNEFRQLLNELVVSAAEELKVMSMLVEPVWISNSADGATSMLNEVEYLSTFSDNFVPTRLGYTCEASRHIGIVSMSPTQLLKILMDANEWAFTFSDIVSKALTLDVASEGMNHNAALRVMAAEYHMPTPLVPNRGTYFARYCTQHCEGVWAVVDVSVDKILPTPENMTCQKRPSGCLIQGMSDGSSKITWIEHVYVDYTGVSTIYRRVLRSGLGFGAKRWVSVLERQCQRILSANVPLSTHHSNNLSMMLSPEGRRGIFMFADRMVNNFIFGITGIRTGRWTEVHENFGDDIRLMSTRAMDDPGLPSGTLLSVATSFVLSLAPNMVFNFFRDQKHRNEWDILANEIELYEPVCRISYGEEASNCVSIYKVMRKQEHMLELQDSWSDPVASHVVFASTEMRTIDAILGGGDLNGLPLLPFGFTILPDGPSSRINGSSGTLLTVSFQVLVHKSPTGDIDFAATTKVTQFLRCHCEKIKHALGAVGPNTGT